MCEESPNNLSFLQENIQAKFTEVQSLLNDSKNDPETEPYKSKYAAKEILLDLKALLIDLQNNEKFDLSSVVNFKSILGNVYLQLGSISVDIEELHKSDEYLKECLSLLENDALNSKNILIVLNVLNSYGILWSQRQEPNKSFEYLSRAEALYKNYIENVHEQPVEISELIFNKTDGSTELPIKSSSLEKLHTSTLYYLAQIHGTLGHAVQSAVYCHITLKRQLESGEYDAVEWALNSATLAQFFLEKFGFTQARHHLAAASYILDLYETELDSSSEGSPEELEAKRERLHHRSADVARCWAKYGLILLSASKDRLLESDESSSAKCTDEFKSLLFSSLDLSSYESQVTDQFCLMYEDARLVFLNVRLWLKKAEDYYQLENHASDYAQIAQDLSELYKLLAFFEDDESRQCKMHKRQIDCLEEVVNKLNPQYYLNVCRQLWFELGETYATIQFIKEGQLQKENCPNPQLLKKCNHLGAQSIKNFHSFINSFQDINGKMPSTFDENWERPVLLAYFYIARMLGKVITVDRQIRLEKTKESLNHYKFIVEYAETHENAAATIGTELGVARDMVALLPLKIEKMIKIGEN